MSSPIDKQLSPDKKERGAPREAAAFPERACESVTAYHPNELRQSFEYALQSLSFHTPLLLKTQKRAEAPNRLQTGGGAAVHLFDLTVWVRHALICPLDQITNFPYRLLAAVSYLS